MDLSEAIPILERTPATLRALLDGIPEPWLVDNEGDDTFSPRDVLGHLIHGEKTDWIARAQRILEHGEAKPFEPFDRFAFRSRDPNEPLADLLEELERLRRANLVTLRDLRLEREQLDLTGTHPELGKVRLSQLLATWVVHDLGHIRQIVRVMAKRYAHEVGPWEAYLRILHE